MTPFAVSATKQSGHIGIPGKHAIKMAITYLSMPTDRQAASKTAGKEWQTLAETIISAIIKVLVKLSLSFDFS